MYRLGRKAVKLSPAHRLAAHSILGGLPAAPASCDNTNGIVEWQAMMNDQIGDCVIAGLAHSLQIATLATGTQFTASDADVVGYYEKWCGYVPGNEATDQGGIEIDVLQDAEDHGFCGHNVIGWSSPNAKSVELIRRAIAYFGSVYVGAELPLSAQRMGGVWDVEHGQSGIPGGWGGHCMVAAKYDAAGIEWITWGKNQRATWDWFTAYVDEAHIILWSDWMNKFPLATATQVENMMREAE